MLPLCWQEIVVLVTRRLRHVSLPLHLAPRQQEWTLYLLISTTALRTWLVLLSSVFHAFHSFSLGGGNSFSHFYQFLVTSRVCPRFNSWCFLSMHAWFMHTFGILSSPLALSIGNWFCMDFFGFAYIFRKLRLRSWGHCGLHTFMILKC